MPKYLSVLAGVLNWSKSNISCRAWSKGSILGLCKSYKSINTVQQILFFIFEIRFGSQVLSVQRQVHQIKISSRIRNGVLKRYDRWGGGLLNFVMGWSLVSITFIREMGSEKSFLSRWTRTFACKRLRKAPWRKKQDLWSIGKRANILDISLDGFMSPN